MLSRDRIDGGHGGGRTDIKCYYSGTWMRLKPLIWAEGPPIGLYGTAVVQGLSSPWARWHSGTRDGVDAKKTDPVQITEGNMTYLFFLFYLFIFIVFGRTLL